MPAAKLRIKPLSEADLDVWARYVQHVRPLAGKPVPEPPKPMPVAASPPLLAEISVAVVKSPVRLSSEVPIDMPPAGLDRSTWLRLKSGRIAPDRKLDLHGMTAARGHHAVISVLSDAARSGQRCVEIVTGRGAGETGGVLRRELPFWLNLPSLRPLVLAVCHPHSGNQGAVRVLLRRARQ
jgi:DNA-nicking Smr family endonuclease